MSFGKSFTRHHSIIYTQDEPPEPLPGEVLTKKAIHVKAKHKGAGLQPTSRLNYSKIYTVEHNIPVADIGEVEKEDIAYIKECTRAILDS
jgi:uncharacterized protein DUF6590